MLAFLLRSQLVVDLESHAVGALLGLEVLAGELLMGSDTPVLVHLVLNLDTGSPVLAGVQVGLEVSGI